MRRLILVLALALTGIAIPGPERPVRTVEVTAEDGTLTVNLVHPDGHVTGYVTVPGVGTFDFDGQRIEEDDPRWNCKTMGNHVCGKGN